MEANYRAVLDDVVRLFVVKERRQRYLELLYNPKRFEDGLDGLLHDPRHLDPSCISEVPSNQDSIESLERLLRKAGMASECYVISANFSEIQQPLKVVDALNQICYNTDSMLYCPVSKVGYYEGHEGWRYLLQRGQSSG